MAEPSQPQESSSLQRKKPPWLRVDIPPQLSLDEPLTLIQPVKRQGFLHSVSMPCEITQSGIATFDPSNYLRPPLQRQPSITETIKSGKRVHFKRVNTVPHKGQKGPRLVSVRRRSSCVPKLVTRRRSSIPKQSSKRERERERQEEGGREE
ncbi:unnamed protein product, partial [Oncorhynchus mykiss]